MDAKKIIQIAHALQSQRKNVEQTWQAIEVFVAPYRGKFFRDNVDESGVQWQKRDIYDSTAVMAHQTLASSLHGSLTNPAVQWFQFQFRDLRLRNSKPAMEWLEGAAKKIYDVLQDSNFNLEINETYRDLTSFGTSFLMEEPKNDFTEDWDGVNFTSIPIKEGYFEDDENGGAYRFYRVSEWSASHIVSKFEADNCPDIVTQALEKGSDSKMEVIFAVYPRALDMDDKEKAILPPEKRPYGWKYVFTSTGDVLAEGGYYEMPAFAVRWLTTSESRWGNSPATTALADILTLNEQVKLSLKMAEKNLDPPIIYDERTLSQEFDHNPGAMNGVRNIDRVKPFETATRPDLGMWSIERLQLAINKYFFVDQLELKDSPAMTATEVQVRYELMQRLLGSTVARLTTDLLDPLISRTFNLLLRAGQLGDIPEEVTDFRAEFDIEYVGPLSRAQRFDQTASLERWVQELTAMAQISPQAEEVLMVPNWPELARMAGRNLNIPENVMNDELEVKDEIDKMRETKGRATEAEIGKTESEGARNMALVDNPSGAA